MTIELHTENNTPEYRYCVIRDGRGGVVRISNDELRILASLIAFRRDNP